MQVILKGGDGGLKQVHQGSKTCKQHSHKEYHHYNVSAWHGRKQVGQIDEHQARASAKGSGAGGCHGRNNDQSGQERGPCVKQGHFPCGADNILIIGQV